MPGKSWLLLILLYVFIKPSVAQWTAPYFQDPETPGINVESFNTNPLQMNMDEEIPAPFDFLILTYTGTVTPTISFSFGDDLRFGHEFVRRDGAWVLRVTRRQDYETLNLEQYIFDVIVGGTRVTVICIINNLIDTPPIVTLLYEGACSARELEANQDTECHIQAYDPDSLYNNELSYRVIGNNREDQLFELREISSDDYSKNYTLIVVEELHFEVREVYNFRIIFTDSGNNEGETRVVVEVEDVPNLPPRWVKPFSTERFEEKTAQTFNVDAIDGDTGINTPIKYRLEFPPGQEWTQQNLVAIDEDTGVISVQPINRDQLKQEVFTFNIIAAKDYNLTWAIDGPAVLIVDDVNDNYPEIYLSPTTVSIPESTYMQLPFTQFVIDDIDLGPHATYTVEMVSLENYADAFTIIPNTGYQETSFLITVSNATFLDYEDEVWQSFQMRIVATEVDLEEHQREQTVQINLINWNDEIPEFAEDEYVVEVLETAGAGHQLSLVQATDRDIDDEVFHSIVGTLGSQFSCSQAGQVSIALNDVLDYERQTSVIIQVQARDSLLTGHPGETLHTVYAQLEIRVLDVNDETPDLRMPRTSPSIVENSPAGTVVTMEILATDPDTTADLEFSIDWSQSYAIKYGQEAEKHTYENCFIIEKHPETINRVFGHLIVNPEFEYDVDYEMYEMIYLTIRVEDLNQEVNEGTAEAILTVRIEDVNDNAPEFIGDTLETLRSVVEEALTGTLIGTIMAEDIDGPQFNQITYSIEAVVEQGTTPGWVRINPSTGVIEVDADQAIDCDDPKLDYLEYVITLSDGDHITTGNIKIDMIDTNNKLPEETSFEKTIEIYENTTEGVFVTIGATDQDRDSPHNFVWFMIDYESIRELQNLFEIQPDTGDLSVRLLGGAQLDRDFGPASHYIPIKYEDNYLGNGRRNSNNTHVTVVLLDVNDNAPVMPSPAQFQPTVGENFGAEYSIRTPIVSTDADDPTTPNSQVSYRILSIEPGEDHADPIPDISNAFEIVSDRTTNSGTLVVKSDLKGCYGTWRITIEAYDHGDEWTSAISLTSNETYNLRIDPYNYNEPRIVYPVAGQTIRLRFNDAYVNSPLVTTNGVPLQAFEALDPDGGTYGDVTFALTGSSNGEDHLVFRFDKEDREKSHLRITELIQSRTYSVNLQARDGGGLYQDLIDVRIIFVDIQGEPFFPESEFSGSFTENTPGLVEKIVIPEAEDPKNTGVTNPEEMFSIYYFLNPESDTFELDSETREMTLKQPLNREAIEMHTLNVIATNNRDGPITWTSGSVLEVQITVIDINDNPPKFELDYYGVGITTSDFVTKALITVVAFDPDTVDQDQLIYYILPETIVAQGTNLEAIKDEAFTMEPVTGVIRLNRAIDDSHTGYFEFMIEVRDSDSGFGPHTDQARVKIYIIAESNRVSFIFLNSMDDVKAQETYIKFVFTERFGFEANIDDIERRSQNDNQTVVRCHFIENSEAIDGDIIRARIVDLDFIQGIQNDLTSRGLFLNGYVPTTPESTNPEDAFQELLNIILTVVCAVLGVLCIVIGIAFYLRNRSLNRQLKALSTTNFGSVSSNLNRMGAPTTNIFAMEGKNPALNDQDFQREFMYDAKSIQSDDSDFVGIDKDPTFMPQKTSMESTNSGIFGGRSLNPMVDLKRDDDYTRF
ncbi:protein dachsous-like [Lutzomyia longipalpis]|uniref:protein dachsous-like n=1 Tax=Lutzomyia longipalpis TaxID=7200 RepID=UPI002483CFE3|nr:protein dachsous-like [Lutzomyia longipalpis]